MTQVRLDLHRKYCTQVHLWLSHSNRCSVEVPEEETDKMINNDIPLKIGNASD